MRTFLDYLTKYQGAIRKFFVALGAALAILVTVMSDGTVELVEWIQVAIAFLSAFGVYGVSNDKSPIDHL